MATTRVWYHGKCKDGFGAALSAYMFLKTTEDVVVFESCAYGYYLPEHKPEDTVYIVDFSFPREDLLRLKQTVAKVVVLDHHLTAQAACEGLDFCTFDMSKSGARLTWEYFHPNKPIPKLIQHIEDRDLWKFEMEGTKEVHAVLDSMEFDFNAWEAVLEQLDNDPSPIYANGSIILKQINKEVDAIVGNMFTRIMHGHRVGFVNSTVHFSEVGHAALETGLIDFAAIFSFVPGKVIVSLRSQGEFDVSVIAKMYGGGGHKNAAGFKMSQQEFFQLLS